MLTRARSIDVLFVIVPHSLLLDIAGPAEAFRLANQHRGLRGLPPRFRLRYAAPVAVQGPRIEKHVRFAEGVNAGFMQVVSRRAIRLRVYERGAGETLACGTGACAAVAAGIRLGLLDARVEVETRGGVLTIEWQGGTAPVLMTGPAETVFEGEIEL